MGIGEVDSSVPDGFDLGAAQLDSGHLVFEKVVEVTGPTILGDHPALFAHATTLAMTATTYGSN